MKATIVTVTMPLTALNIPQKQWWVDALIATFGNPMWKPIIANNVFTIASTAGTFILDTKNFASGMMCDLNTWHSVYKQGFQMVVNAITQGATISEQEINV